jgi:CRP-like cAMP-binding protein
MTAACRAIDTSYVPDTEALPYPTQSAIDCNLVSEVAIALAEAGLAGRMRDYRPGELIYQQGDESGDMLFLKSGVVKYFVLARSGHEAVLALYGPGAFLGEACLAGQRYRTGSAVAIDRSRVLSVDATVLRRLLFNRPALAVRFLGHMLQRNMRTEEGLLDQMFNTGEKRLARVLLMLARESAPGQSEDLVPKISQATLAEMVGTTRSRVNVFLNRFRKHGLIEYDSHRRLRVTKGLRLVLER